MQDVIKQLNIKKEKLKKELKETETAITSLQVVCDHNFLYDGHDSHYNIYKCTVCGLISKS